MKPGTALIFVFTESNRVTRLLSAFLLGQHKAVSLCRSADIKSLVIAHFWLRNLKNSDLETFTLVVIDVHYSQATTSGQDT